MQAWAAALSTACDWLSGGKKPVGDNSVLEGWPFQRESDKGAGATWVGMRTDRGAGSPKPPPNGRHHIFLFFFFFPERRTKQAFSIEPESKEPSSHPPPVIFVTRWIVQIKWWQLPGGGLKPSWFRLVSRTTLRFCSRLERGKHSAWCRGYVGGKNGIKYLLEIIQASTNASLQTCFIWHVCTVSVIGQITGGTLRCLDHRGPRGAMAALPVPQHLSAPYKCHLILLTFEGLIWPSSKWCHPLRGWVFSFSLFSFSSVFHS